MCELGVCVMVLEFSTNEEMLKHFGEGLGWELERQEFTNLEGLGPGTGVEEYQTADDIDIPVYPEPTTMYRFTVENQTASLEESYYWLLHFLKFDMGFAKVDKIYDIFSASESSALFGNNAQRLAIQQDKASQYLVQIGQLVKQLFPLVRELRVIDERLEMYDNWKKNKSADISLKHTYINLVEGGTQNPDSVYGLAQRLGFTVLPDLFLGTHVYSTKDVDNEVDNGSASEFNKSVKAVLKRKLFLYINWKEKTEKELRAKRQFQLRYMRQHWNVIKLYIDWLKPYLRSASRLTQNKRLTDSAEIISAFDTTRAEIEVLVKKPHDLKKKDGHYQCVIVNCSYTTVPKMAYNPQYQQQNVAQTGRIDVSLRSYGWHEKDIEAFKKMRQQEDINMLKTIDGNVAGALDALGEDFENYLLESEDVQALEKDAAAKKKQKAHEKKLQEAYNKKKKEGYFDIFTSVGKGFQELFTAGFDPEKKKAKKDSEEPKGPNKKIKEKAAKSAAFFMGVTFQVYKKAHKMINW